MSILTNLRNIFPFPFPHNLRRAPSQTVDVGAYVVCHISQGSATNPLQDKKKGLGNLIKFFKTFNHMLVWGNIYRDKNNFIRISGK